MRYTKALVEYFECVALRYKADKDKVPPFYVNENGGVSAKSDKVFYHPKVQEDLEHYTTLKGY